MHNPLTSSRVAILEARWQGIDTMAARRRHRGRAWVPLTLAICLASCADESSGPVAPTPAETKALPVAPTMALLDGSNTLAVDGFSRLVSGGWGDAEVGGTWQVGSSDFVVDGTQGLVVAPNKNPRIATLGGVQAVDGSGLVSFSIDRAPDNPSRSYAVEVYTRRIDSDNYYRFRVRAFGNGEMDLRAEKNANDVSTWLTDNTPVSAVWQPSMKYWIRWECEGVSPSTAIRMRVWQDGTPEPFAWHIATVVDEPALDLPGTIGFRVSGPTADQIAFPITFAFDDLEYVGTDATNQAPVADPGGPYAGVPLGAIQFDGTGSSDPEGDLPLSYGWTFGDGSTASGASPSHTYASTGAYAVTLTVTDARGRASLPVASTATIVPENPNDLVKDRFSRVETGGWGRPEVGGSWFAGGGSNAAAFEVNGGQGLIVLRDTKPRNVVATEGYGMHVDGLVSFSIDLVPDDPNRFYQIQTYSRRNDRLGDGEDYYRYRVRAFGDGRMDLRIEKDIDGTLTWLTPNTNIPIVWEAGAKYWIRWECIGTSPSTTISMKIWRDGTVEPTAPQVSATVDEPELDETGTTGVRVSPPSGQTTFPVTFSFDDLAYVIRN